MLFKAFSFPLSHFAADVFRRRSSAVQVRGDQMAARFSRMISAQARFRVCREGKSVPTPLSKRGAGFFRIMRKKRGAYKRLKENRVWEWGVSSGRG